MTNKERIIAHNNLIDRAINKANSLPNAGGSTNPTASPKDVNFYDYDGTILYSYTVEEAQALTELPPLPTREGLVCQEWNYDLATIKEYNRAVNVGATYITDDGKTRLYIKITTKGRMTVPLYFSQTVANGVVIDWGDGSATETLSGTGNKNTSHTYAKIGDYIISLEVTKGTLGLGHGSSSYCVMGTTNNDGKIYCNMLQKVEIGNSVTSIGYNAFGNCYSLASVVIPDSVTSINTTAFSDCYPLVSIVIPDSVTSIGNNAFYNCHSLVSVVIPDSVTSINSGAFGSCNSLVSIVIPDSVTSIGNTVFTNCRSFASVVIPESVTSIGHSAFSGCYPLASVVIPDSVTSIGSDAFYNCYPLASIVIPDSVTSIGSRAFGNCYSLASVVIPDSVTSISANTFNSCYSLASVVIPDSVTSINTTAFYNCYGMAIYDFTSHTSVPTLSSASAFTGIPTDCVIKVPAALYDEWIAATNWSTYADHIVAV